MDSLHDYYKQYGLTDAGAITDKVIYDLGLDTDTILYPAIYMHASAWVDQQGRLAASSHFLAKKQLREAKASGMSDRVAVAEAKVLDARQNYLDSTVYNGQTHVPKGDATVPDWEGFKAWVTRHELNPAQNKIKEADDAIQQIQSAGVTTLREVS